MKDLSWLELLSSLDKMVLGSIVGSVILAFLLIVVIFSVRIQALHEVIRGLRASLDEQEGELRLRQKMLDEHARQIADDQTLLAHYQETEAKQIKAIETVRTEQEKAKIRIRDLNNEITRLRTEKQELSAAAVQAQGDLEHAREEIQAVLKRNEFWVEQLSELRTKHDALLLKLRRREQTPS